MTAGRRSERRDAVRVDPVLRRVRPQETNRRFHVLNLRRKDEFSRLQRPMRNARDRVSAFDRSASAPKAAVAWNAAHPTAADDIDQQRRVSDKRTVRLRRQKEVQLDFAPVDDFINDVLNISRFKSFRRRVLRRRDACRKNRRPENRR